MKIGIVLGAFSVGTRPLDFTNVFANKRGLTGTDLAFVRLCQEFKRLGHDVHAFTVQSSDLKSWQGITLHPAHTLPNVVDDSFDAVINFNEPNLFIGLKTKAKKIVYMMLNDFSFIKPGFNEWTDLYVGVCDEHSRYVENNSNTPGKWRTVSLGCDPELYEDRRVPGRVLWCSSADRGLHWLLSQWSQIKEEVPHASLRVLYHFNYDQVIDVEPHSISPQGGPYHHHIQEMAQRVRYIREALERLKDLDVVHVGSASREQMVQEWNEASVFGFSADTVAFSEGFSVSTLEAHASFTVPVITDCDCLGGIYKDSGAIVIPGPVGQNLDQFREAVIEQLSNPDPVRIQRCREFAQKRTWKECARQLENIIKGDKGDK